MTSRSPRPTPSARPPDESGWASTPAFAAGIGLGLVLLAAGLLTARADVALLGVPVLAAAAWGHSTRPQGGVTVDFVPDAAPAAPGTLTSRIHVRAPVGCDLVHLRVTAPDVGDLEQVLHVDTERYVTLTSRSVRTGLRPTFRVDHKAYGRHGALEQHPADTTAPPRLVLPRLTTLRRLPAPHQLRGLTGPHTSRRMGDGSELRDIDEYRPGDRMRRIDWRTTARRSPSLETLHVRRTYATAEATVMLVVDSRDDVGPDLTTWGGAGTLRPEDITSLDVARHAATSVAQAVIDAGDRVGYEDLGRMRRPVPPAGGRRQLRRIVHGLALARPYGEPRARHRPPQVPSGATLYLFSTFLDDEASRLAQIWHEHGHQVVAVDTLPPVRLAGASPTVTLAWRITRMEREDRVHALTLAGIDVIRWIPADDTTPAPHVQLEAAARRAARHRPAVRHR
ncbi:DUF58 domain-containing protein [Oerskovia flava]|uniref:DUF58 domain-containing protein n=1 Tax=Oerskovia flava TaxID=2986422 RepID=UPI00224057AD|nr:DUF58 domain-containing protein [Oerskovia sp. JB1-3-2]